MSDVAWCSWCFQKAVHEPTDAGTRIGWPITIYSCVNCSSPTVHCMSPGCNKMACTGDDVRHLFCATHRGEIASFAAQSALIDDPTDFGRLFDAYDDDTSSDVNVVRIGKKGVTLAAGLVVGGVAFRVAGAAMAGARGAALGYKGAVATKVGWAKLGGGALSKGGWGMAGGKLRLATQLSGKGLWRSWQVSNAYFNELDGFQVRKIRDGRDPALICINGFRTEEPDAEATRLADEAWLQGLGQLFADRAVYRVQWPSSTSGTIVGEGVQIAKSTWLGARMRLAGRASKVARSAGALPFMAGSVADKLVDFSWPVAVSNAHKTGHLLAELIARCDNRSFILMGHSLGARVCVVALRRLAKRAAAKPASQVTDVFLFGGALNARDSAYWQPVVNAITGRCASFYSTNDSDLLGFYRAGTMTIKDYPIGRGAIPVSAHLADRILSFDVTERVSGHTKYHENLHELLQRCHHSVT